MGVKNKHLYESIMYDVAKIVKRHLNENDLCPEDKDGNVSLSMRESINHWKMLYRLMDNVKTMMDSHLRNKGDISKIGAKDVDEVLQYIKDSVQNVMNTYK